MRNKLSVVLLTAFLFGMFLSASYAADNLHPKTTFNVDRAPKFMIPYEPASEVDFSTPSTMPLRTDQANRAAIGTLMGQTTYDYQHNGAMGRMLAINQNAGWVFIGWMGQQDFTIPGARDAYMNAFEPSTGDLAYSGVGGYNASDQNYAGYVVAGWTPNDGMALGCHMADDGTAPFNSTRFYDQMSPFFIPAPHKVWPDETADWYETDLETIWPVYDAHDADSAGVTENVEYLLSHKYEGQEDLILYRKKGGADATDNWDGGKYIVTATNLSYTIATDPKSDIVAIAYTDDRESLGGDEGDGGQTDLDVYYMYSTDQGDNWSVPVNMSNYTEDSLWRAYSDLSAVITYDGFGSDGYLHVIAPIRELRSATSYENYKCRLIHWSANLQTNDVSTASVVDEARYNMELAPGRPCDCGAWNMYIAKPSISYCDSALYALYTKFGDDHADALWDCSQSAFANGELYLAASDDWGATWDTGWNLTKTRSQNCDSALCESEHWSSMARYGWYYGGGDPKDSLDIMYIYDRDAGGIPQGEGAWTVNDVMYYRFECRNVEHIAKVSLEPNSFEDPTHTAPYTAIDVTLKISNIGNADLNISSIAAQDVGDGTDWIGIGTYDAVVAPSSFTEVTITLNDDLTLGDVDPAGYDANLLVNHDAPGGQEVIPIHLTVASDFNMPQDTLLNTTCKALRVYNTARIGGDNDNESLDIPGDCDSVDTPPNEVMYLYDGSPMIAWNDGTENLAYTTVFTQDFTEDGTFRPQSDINFYSETDYDMAVCTVTTTDSLYGVAIKLYAPTDGTNCFIIGDYTFFNWNPIKDASEVYLGYMIDWDIPSDNSVDNGSGHDEALQTIWQFGADYDGTDPQDNTANCPVPIVETDRLGGMAVFEGAVTNAWSEENAPYQLGSGYDKEYLYEQMSTLSGYNSWDEATDSTIDLHSAMTFEAVDMTAKAEYRYVFGLVTTNQGEADYLAQVSQARAWAVDQGIIVDFVCDCLPGDANNDAQQNVGDAVYLINFVFKQGPAPVPYEICSGDANGDCQANVGDAVYLINYVFKQGPPPPTCDEWVNGGGAFGGCGQPLVK